MDNLTRPGNGLANNAILKVVGIGGGGSNAVDRMIAESVDGVEFVAMNTDAQALAKSKASLRLRVGDKVTRGLGCGGNPACGEKAAQESADEIKEVLRGADMVFVTAGMGGGTGTGGAPVVAEIARQLGALTVSVVTKPFGFEGARRMKLALEGIGKLQNCVDTLVVIPNDRLLQILPPKASMRQAFLKADDLLRQGIQGISDLIVHTGLINVDFNDVRTIMGASGSALMSIGRGSGETRAMDAILQAVNSDLLEVSINGARGVLLNFKGNMDMTLHEINEAADVVRAMVDPEAEIIVGADYDENIGDDIQITVIATGFEAQPRTAVAQPRLSGQMAGESPRPEVGAKIIKLPPRDADAATGGFDANELPPWMRRNLSER